MQLRYRVGRIRCAMFTLPWLVRYIKAETDANTAVVTFAGNALRITTVHQFGLRGWVHGSGD
ncbi:tail completion-like protein (plasmid) [Ralstonia solanacearum Po82]|uniref:Tail completion-like protein n=1 Tax=Ralstonia solanacearum (strain Po82) TaxID=1031711 RepID=F6GB59_RALS8|nr:tail completion-like protein [Ralstonia solanacearum Po82]